jgi:hypothetical protein
MFCHERQLLRGPLPQRRLQALATQICEAAFRQPYPPNLQIRVETAASTCPTAAKRFKKIENATALIWKLLQVAESTFRRLKGAELLPPVSGGVLYTDGVRKSSSIQRKIAA